MTPHFKKEELACRCGCGMLPEQDFMDRIEELRVRFGMPLKVTSAARCATYNVTVSATGATGPHTTGRAIDFDVNRLTCWLLLRLAMEMGFTGIGVNQKGEGRFLHIDDVKEGRPTVWSY